MKNSPRQENGCDALKTEVDWLEKLTGKAASPSCRQRRSHRIHSQCADGPQPAPRAETHLPRTVLAFRAE